MKSLSLGEMTGKDEDNTSIHIEQPPEDSFNDTIALKAVDELMNPKKIKTITRISKAQVPVLTKLLLYGDTFQTPFMKKLAKHIMELQISLDGQGRKELVQLVQQRSIGMINVEPQPKKKLFG